MQTYTPALDTMGNLHMEPVGNGDWIRAEDHSLALLLQDSQQQEVADVLQGRLHAQISMLVDAKNAAEAAIANARDDALREAKAAVSVVGIGFYDRISSDWHKYSAADVHFACLLAVSALIGQPTPPREQCCVCGADVDTCEVSEGGGPDGAQLSGGKWVCSSECFDAVAMTYEVWDAVDMTTLSKHDRLSDAIPAALAAISLKGGE